MWLLQAVALAKAAAMQEELLKCEAETAAQLAAESARRAQAEEAVEQYIAAHYASQAAAQVPSITCECDVHIGTVKALPDGAHQHERVR